MRPRAQEPHDPEKTGKESCLEPPESARPRGHRGFGLLTSRPRESTRLLLSGPRFMVVCYSSSRTDTPDSLASVSGREARLRGAATEEHAGRKGAPASARARRCPCPQTDPAQPPRPARQGSSGRHPCRERRAAPTSSAPTADSSVPLEISVSSCLQPSLLPEMKQSGSYSGLGIWCYCVISQKPFVVCLWGDGGRL